MPLNVFGRHSVRIWGNARPLSSVQEAIEDKRIGRRNHLDLDGSVNSGSIVSERLGHTRNTDWWKKGDTFGEFLLLESLLGCSSLIEDHEQI